MANVTKSRVASDSIVPDLSQERDELLANFSKGSQLTKEFLDAYDQLQEQVRDLRQENADLRRTVEADDAIQQLISKITALEAEKTELLTKASGSRDDAYPTRGELESELANFANLHVASNCLHSTLSPSGVGRRIKEILEQLVGVDAYVIYLCRPELSPIAAEGLKPDDNLADAPMDRLSEVVHSGVSSIKDDIDPSRGTVSQPSALIPLSIDDQVVGVLSIIRSLPHKRQLTNIDFELFKLLGQHAAAALMASGLYAQAGRVLPTPDAFGSLQH